FDVGGGGEPPNHVSVVIHHWVVAKEEPAKPAVFTEQPFFHFEWDTLRKTETSFALDSLQIVGMNISGNSLASTDAFHFLKRVSLVIEHGPVDLQKRAVLVQDKHMLRKSVHELAQLTLVLPELVLGPFPILDVRARRIPARDVSVVIDDWLVLNEKPSVLPVRSVHALLILKRHRTGECAQPRLMQSRDVIGVEHPFAKSCGLHFLEWQSGVLEGDAIRRDGFAVWTQHHNRLRDGVGHAAKLGF